MHGHQVATKTQSAANPHPSARALQQTSRAAVTAPLHRHRIVTKSKVRSDCALHAARTRHKARGAITAPCHRHEIVIEKWVRGTCAPPSTRTLRENIWVRSPRPFIGTELSLLLPNLRGRMHLKHSSVSSHIITYTTSIPEKYAPQTDKTGKHCRNSHEGA